MLKVSQSEHIELCRYCRLPIIRSGVKKEYAMLETSLMKVAQCCSFIISSVVMVLTGESRTRRVAEKESRGKGESRTRRAADKVSSEIISFLLPVLTVRVFNFSMGCLCDV